MPDRNRCTHSMHAIFSSVLARLPRFPLANLQTKHAAAAPPRHHLTCIHSGEVGFVDTGNVLRSFAQFAEAKAVGYAGVDGPKTANDVVLEVGAAVHGRSLGVSVRFQILDFIVR